MTPVRRRLSTPDPQPRPYPNAELTAAFRIVRGYIKARFDGQWPDKRSATDIMGNRINCHRPGSDPERWPAEVVWESRQWVEMIEVDEISGLLQDANLPFEPEYGTSVSINLVTF
jgi:hypothetical protein